MFELSDTRRGLLAQEDMLRFRLKFLPYNNGVNWWRYKKTKNDDRFYSTWYRSRDPDNDGSACE